MKAELDAFFETIVLEGGSFKALFLSSVGFVNEDTAALYGLGSGQFGAELTRAELDASQRSGFITRLGSLFPFRGKR